MHQSTSHDSSRPRWENMVESPIIEQESSKYRLKLRYGGYFRLPKNSCRKKYCFGFQKCINMDKYTYDLNQLTEEVVRHYPSMSDLGFSIVFLDKHAKVQTFIELDSDDNFVEMLTMYEDEKEVFIYVTTGKSTSGTSNNQEREQHETTHELHDEDNSDYCPNEESYHSRFSEDDEGDIINYEGETSSYSTKCPSMKVSSKYPNVIAFRRALNHYALANEFEYFIEKSEPTRFTARCAIIECEWKIHVGVMHDKVTFEVRKHEEEHSCTRSSKGGNRCATQAWIADVVTDKLKSDGDVSPTKLKKWLLKTYNVEIPYLRVFRGMEQAYTELYGKWDDAFIKMDAFRGELLNRNPGSVVEILFEKDGNKKRFQRFFISLTACSSGFLAGCRPYIGLDACHLKGKYNGVLAAATSIDGNNSIFPLAYAVLESENTKSWTWFLESLKKAIGMPNGLVISSDMQKGLEVAIMQVYPSVEHRECIKHLYSNFKKHFRGDFYNYKLWSAARTYCINEHNRLLKEIAEVRPEVVTYLNGNHNKIWSRSKFGTTSKCDYITNNISESFNSWVGALRYKPVLELLDGIRDKLMRRFDKKRKTVKKWKGSIVPKANIYLKSISKNLGAYEVFRSSDNRVEVEYKGKRYEVILNERKCTCLVWQVTGLPCIHAAAFIAFTRDTDWVKYVDSYFTITNYKEAYALEIAPLPGKDQWVERESDEKIYPPILKCPPGRPKKERMKPPGEAKRKHKCPRCGGYGHHEKKCKNPSSQAPDSNQTSTSKRRRGKYTKARESCAI